MKVLKSYFLGLALVAIFLGGAVLGTAFPEWFPYFIGGIIVLILLAASAGFAAWAVNHEIKKKAEAEERKFTTDSANHYGFSEAKVVITDDSDEAKSVNGADFVSEEEDTTGSDKDGEFKPTSEDWEDIMSYSDPDKAEDESGEAKAAATIKKADAIIAAGQET